MVFYDGEYNFYLTRYGGNSLSYEDFIRIFPKASAKLSRYERIYTVKGSEDERKKALCSMTDALYYFECVSNGMIVTSSSVGSVSSSAAAPQTDLSAHGQERELYRCASEYLEIYRGCS